MQEADTVSNTNISLVFLCLESSYSSAKGQQKFHLCVKKAYTKACEMVSNRPVEKWKYS